MHAYRNRHRRGFTLIEMIVVFAILAILGGMLVGAIGGHLKHNTATQSFNSSEPRPSPAIPLVSSAPANVGYQLQVNDPNEYVAMANLLKANGYSVEPVNEKTCLVFKPSQK